MRERQTTTGAKERDSIGNAGEVALGTETILKPQLESLFTKRKSQWSLGGGEEKTPLWGKLRKWDAGHIWGREVRIKSVGRRWKSLSEIKTQVIPRVRVMG